MNNKPLTPQSLLAFNEYFNKSNAEIDILDEFFFNSLSLVDEGHSYISENIEELVSDMDFQSLEEANIFIGHYIDFTNATISFIELLEKNDSTNKEENEDLISKLYYTFLEIYKNNLAEITSIILSNSTDLVITILEKYEIDLHEEENEDLDIFASEIDDKIGKGYSAIIFAILSMVDEIEMEPGTNDEERIDSLFLLTMIFIMKMNIIRKEEFKKNMGSGKSTKDPGRNDPCPCGSGLKFKKCCLSKLH